MCEFSQQERRTWDERGELRIKWSTKKADCNNPACKASDANEQPRKQFPNQKAITWPDHDQRTSSEDDEDDYALEHFPPDYEDRTRDWVYDYSEYEDAGRETDYAASQYGQQYQYQGPHNAGHRDQELDYAHRRKSSKDRNARKSRSKPLVLGAVLGVATALFVSEVAKKQARRKDDERSIRPRRRERDWGYESKYDRKQFDDGY